MAFIVQRARVRALRRHDSAGTTLLGGSPLGPDFGAPIPALNRALRRAATARRPITAALIPAVLLGVLALNATHPFTGSRQQIAPAVNAPTLDAATSAGTTGGLAGLAAPGFPGGIGFATAAAQPAARVPAVVAADLWQAANAVYQSATLGPILVSQSAPGTGAAAVTKPSGPTLNELLNAQARVATAQLVLLSLQQRATDDQIAAAQGAVTQAQAELDQAQAAITQSNELIARSQALSPTATAGAAAATQPGIATPTPEQIAAAQGDVDRARAALLKAQHPFSDDQIAAARTELTTAENALNAAQQRAAVLAMPKPAIATAAPTAATAPPAAAKPAATAAPSTGSADTRPAGAPVAPTGDGRAAGSTSGPSDTRPAGGSAVGAGQGESSGPSQALSTVAGADVAGDSGARAAVPGGQADGVTAPAAAAPAPVEPPAAAAPATAATAAAVVTPVPAATPAPGASSERATTGNAHDDLPALQQRVDLAEKTLALYTAPPDAETVQFAAEALQAAEQRLAALAPATAAAGLATTPGDGTAAVASATPSASPTPAATATPSAAGASAEPVVAVDAAQARYQQALTQLQWLSAKPDAATMQAANDEYRFAKQSLDDLVASADASVSAQLDPDPQTALAKVGLTSGSLPLRDVVPFIWPASGPITSFFGPSHPLGIDIAQGLGLPLRAAASGVVTFSGGDPCCSYGYYVDIQHAGGYMTRYGHLLTRSFLKPGDKVVQGQIIGVSGSTGFSTGPHLHFEIRFNGVPINPLRLLAGALPAPPTR